MNLTEDQAKEKWCPYFVDYQAKGIGGKCWASECMMWRWHAIYRSKEYDVEYRKRYPELEEQCPLSERKGYCGLAGGIGGGR